MAKMSFPGDMVRRLETLGRFEMDGDGSGTAAEEVRPTCVTPFREQATANPHGFVTALRVVVRGTDGGLAVYGASCLVAELLGTELESDDALDLLDRAIDVKRERGLPIAALKDHEQQRWLAVNGPGSW